MAFHSQKSPLLGPHQLQNEDFPPKAKHIYSGKWCNHKIIALDFTKNLWVNISLMSKKTKTGMSSVVFFSLNNKYYLFFLFFEAAVQWGQRLFTRFLRNTSSFTSVTMTVSQVC